MWRPIYVKCINQIPNNIQQNEEKPKEIIRKTIYINVQLISSKCELEHLKCLIKYNKKTSQMENIDVKMFKTKKQKSNNAYNNNNEHEILTLIMIWNEKWR